MFKKVMIALAAFGALAAISPAEAHRDRGRASVVITYGSPGYYGGYYGNYYHAPRYRYRPYYYDNRRYYRPHKRYWKKRHWRHHRRW